MVDVGRVNDQVDKSTAYTELSDQCWQRDGEAEFDSTYFEHMQKTQRCYASALEEGWSQDEMKSEQSIDWLTQNVEWRVGQAGRCQFDMDYFRLVYDDYIEAGVLIDNVRRRLGLDTAGGIAGDSKGKKEPGDS